MAKRWTLGRRERVDIPTDSSEVLTAAARLVDNARTLYIQRDAWQGEAWGFYHTQGEFRYAVDWCAAANSRVRLRAARMDPGADEPEIIDSGPVADIVNGIGGGPGGQAQLMSRFTTLLQIPGDSYGLVTGTAENSTWEVYAASIIKKSGTTLQVQVGQSEWATVAPNKLPVRVYNPDAERPWLATSPSQSIIGVLGEIDLYNRHIITTLTSRLASNGLLILPQEMSFGGLATSSQAPNALVPQLIEVASQAIKNPGSAAAAIPIPLEVPAQYADVIRHLSFASEVSDKILDARDKALTRLARSLNVPAEILTGIGGVNHWGAWQIEDSAIKIHLTPIIETICDGLTVGYLEPALKAARIVPEDSRSKYVVWYDVSELQQKPDMAERAVQLHDRVAINDEALRNAAGFDEGSKPTNEQIQQQILTRLAYNGQAITDALSTLTGTPASSPSPTAPTGARDTTPPGVDGGDDAGSMPIIPDTIAEITDSQGSTT
jgi:hypothetical protein